MTTKAETPAPAKRMTLSQVVEMLLTRSGTERSSVTLTRNAKGDTQIIVTVRTGDTAEIATAIDAEQAAVDIYDRLRASYPLSNGNTGEGTAAE